MVGLVNQALKEPTTIVGTKPRAGETYSYDTAERPPLAVDGANDMGGVTGWNGSITGAKTNENPTNDVIELPPGSTYTGDPDDTNPPTTGPGNDTALPFPKPGTIPNKPPPDDGLDNDGLIPPGGNTDLGGTDEVIGGGTGESGNYSTNPYSGQDPGANTGNEQFSTVQGNLDMMNQGLIDLLDQSNPLMQQAALAGRRGANARGLGSSSYAERAAQGAVFDIALPMVQQAQQTAASLESLARQQGFASSQAMLDRALREFEQTRDIEYREWLQNTTNRHQELLQTSELAQMTYNNFMASAMEILNNPETSEDQKQAAIDQLQGFLDSSLALLDGTSNVDLGRFLPGGGTGGSTGPFDGQGPYGGGRDTGNPSTDPQYWQGMINNLQLPGGMTLSQLGQFNEMGGMTSVSGDWTFSDVFGDSFEAFQGAGQVAWGILSESVVSEWIVDQLPEGTFEDDSVWTSILGLGINLAATPLNIITNLLGEAWDWLFGDEEGDTSDNGLLDPDNPSGPGTGGGVGVGGGGNSTFGGASTLPGNSYEDYQRSTVGQFITYQEWLRGRQTKG